MQCFRDRWRLTKLACVVAEFKNPKENQGPPFYCLKSIVLGTGVSLHASIMPTTMQLKARIILKEWVEGQIDDILLVLPDIHDFSIDFIFHVIFRCHLPIANFAIDFIFHHHLPITNFATNLMLYFCLLGPFLVLWICFIVIPQSSLCLMNFDLAD
jgi:hypothetical protein